MRRIRNSLIVWMLCSASSPAGAQTLQPDFASLARQAMELQAAGRYAEAADAYRELEKLDSTQVATHVNLAIVLVQLGRFDEAIVEYGLADKLLPNDPRIALNTALAYEKAGNLAEAKRRFAALHAASPDDSKMTKLLADCDLQMGRDEEVIELLTPIEKSVPDDPAVAYMLGMALLRQQRVDEAQPRLDRILRNGDSPEARFLLGARLFESGDYPAAVAQFQSAAQLEPDLPLLQSFLGQALLNKGDPDAAAAAFRKELAANPNDFAANLRLGQILLVRKEDSDAKALLESAVRVRPESPEANLGLAECLVGLNHFVAARPYAEAAVKAAPDSGEAHQTLAAIYRDLRMPDAEARERARAATLAAKLKNADPGPGVNTAAPDFELADAVSGETISLTQLRDKGPVVLVFGSYTCPNFRAAAESLKDLYRRYGTRAHFLLVYIREAHATDNWQSTRNSDLEISPPANASEKKDHALMCRRKLHLPFPAVVDGMDNKVEAAYNAWPSRLFLIDSSGIVRYRTRLTELDFHGNEVESVLGRLVKNEKTSAAVTNK